MKKISLVVVISLTFLFTVAGSARAYFFTPNGSFGWNGSIIELKSTAGGILIDPANGQVEIDGALTVASCSGCDFVFESDYPLMTLDELGDFVRREGHLPGMTINKGLYDQAAHHFEKAESLIKTDPGIYEHLGDVYLKLKKHNEALECYSKALALKPADEKKIKEKISKLTGACPQGWADGGGKREGARRSTKN